MSSESRAKMSISAAKRVRSKRETYTSAHGGFRKDLGCYFRSNWEANYARILQFEGKHWMYEPTTFHLDEGTYTPDFSVEGIEGFIEIKGRIDDEIAMKKVKAFIIKHSEISVIFIGPKEYDELRKHYKKLVAWEGK